VKRKPKSSRLAAEAARKWHAMRHTSTLEHMRAYFEGREPVPDLPGYDPNYRGMEGPGETFSSELWSWIEEQNVINGAIAESVRRGLRRGGNKKADDVAIWREFQRLRPTSKKSDTALTEEIGRKYGLKRSAAIEARKRGEKLAGS
jgi:hypothetical protein